MRKYKPYLLMVLATILFAGAFIAGKIGASDFSPVVMTFLRIGLATIIIFPIMMFTEKKDWKASLNELQLAFILGLIGMTFYHLFFFAALKYTTASNASVINATMPIVTAILCIIFLKDKLNIRQVFLIIVAFIGVILTVTQWDLTKIFEMNLNKGDFLMFCGTVSWSTYGILVKRGIKDTSPLKLTAYTFMMCSIILLPFASYQILYKNALSVSVDSYYTILYMAIFPTVIGYTIQQSCIKTIGPSTAALFINLVPVFTILLSFLILNETIMFKSMISVLIIIVSVILFLLSSK